VGRGLGSVEGPSLRQQTFRETCCVPEPLWLSELTFKRALPKENQMELCKQLGLAGAQRCTGGKGNNVGVQGRPRSVALISLLALGSGLT